MTIKNIYIFSVLALMLVSYILYTMIRARKGARPGHEEREADDRYGDPADDGEPAAAERAPAALLAREADRPHARATLGEHAAVAAHWLAAARAGARGERTAAEAPRGAAAAVDRNERTRHAAQPSAAFDLQLFLHEPQDRCTGTSESCAL